MEYFSSGGVSKRVSEKFHQYVGVSRENTKVGHQELNPDGVKGVTAVKPRSAGDFYRQELTVIIPL